MSQPEQSDAARQRENRLRLLEDDIGRALAHSEASGELRAAPSWGKPLDLGDGYDETPAELRMPMKVLKDAGVLPPEVEVMQRIAALQAQADRSADPAQAAALRREAGDLRLALQMRLERLRATGTL